MARTKSRELKCDRCDATLRVEATAPNRQIDKVLHDMLCERVRAEGWTWLKIPFCADHAHHN